MFIQILNAPYDRPANLTTSITGFYSYTGNLQAYYENRALAPSVVYLRQEGGLQHANDGLEVPQSYLTGSGTNGASDGSQQVRLRHMHYLQREPFELLKRPFWSLLFQLMYHTS